MIDVPGKINLAMTLYGIFAFAIVLAQQAFNWMEQLPPWPLALIAGAVIIVSGIASFYWEKRANPAADVRANISFAFVAGCFVGLPSYYFLCVQHQLAAIWLTDVLVAGFMNQVILASIAASKGLTIRQYFAQKHAKTLDFARQAIVDRDEEDSQDGTTE